MPETQPGTELIPADDPSELAVSDEVLTNVVRGINELSREATLRLAVDIGNLIVTEFYDGDMEQFRSRRQKDVSLRKLADHPELAMSRSSLHQAVAVFDLVERMGGVHACGHLGVSHVRAVLPLPEKEQRRLLRQAESYAWTVRKIEDKARLAKSKLDNRGGGRPRLPSFVKAINALRKFTEDDGPLLDELDRVEDLAPADARRLYDTVHALKMRCEALEEKLQSQSTSIGEVE